MEWESANPQTGKNKEDLWGGHRGGEEDQMVMINLHEITFTYIQISWGAVNISLKEILTVGLFFKPSLFPCNIVVVGILQGGSIQCPVHPGPFLTSVTDS